MSVSAQFSFSSQLSLSSPIALAEWTAECLKGPEGGRAEPFNLAALATNEIHDKRIGGKLLVLSVSLIALLNAAPRNSCSFGGG